jgi:flavin-dependent dehydrogenase
MMPETRVVIVGGGLAGLIASIHLAKHGIISTVVEKQQYPFHRVCGEYISNEVLPYLQSLDAYPLHLGPSALTRFQLTATNGASVFLPLDQGGFGISRYALDHFLQQKAQQLGVSFLLQTEASAIQFASDRFLIETTQQTMEAELVIGAFGKRSKIDKYLNRPFMTQHSPYVGVKYHLQWPDFPDNLIALHNFSGGYCGISRVENSTINLCYLTHRDNLRENGNIRSMEENVLFQNPFIKNIFEKAEFLFERPETINEISFETKAPVEDHLLMAGDAAGMITPLCGNGMAIAIHSAKILSEHVLRYFAEESYTRAQLEKDYAAAWKRQFAARLWFGRQVQRLFGSTVASNLAVNLGKHTQPIARFLMERTHGKPF